MTWRKTYSRFRIHLDEAGSDSWHARVFWDDEFGDEIRELEACYYGTRAQALRDVRADIDRWDGEQDEE